MKTVKSENFFVGFNSFRNNKHNKAVLYYKSQPFANIWVNPPGHFSPKNEGKWTINRDDVALEFDFPSDGNDFDTIEDLLNFCESWAKENLKF